MKSGDPQQRNECGIPQVGKCTGQERRLTDSGKALRPAEPPSALASTRIAVQLLLSDLRGHQAKAVLVLHCPQWVWRLQMGGKEKLPWQTSTRMPPFHLPLAMSRYSQEKASKRMNSNPVKKSLGVGFGRPLSKEVGIRQFITLGTGMEDNP